MTKQRGILLSLFSIITLQGFNLCGQNKIDTAKLSQLWLENIGHYRTIKTVTLGEKGVLISAHQDDHKIQMALYDSNFQRIQTWEHQGNADYLLVDAQISNDFIIVLLAPTSFDAGIHDGINISLQKFEIVRLNIKDNKLLKIIGKGKGNLNVKKMLVNDNQVLICGTRFPTTSQTAIRNCINIGCLFIPTLFGLTRIHQEGLVIQADFDTKKVNTIPFEFNSNISVMDADMSADGKNATVLLQSSSNLGQQSTLIKKVILMEKPELSPTARTIQYSGLKQYTDFKVNILNDQEKVYFGNIGSKPRNTSHGTFIESFIFIYENQGKQIFSRDIPFKELNGLNTVIGSSNFNTTPGLRTYRNSFFGRLIYHPVLDEEDHFLILAEYFEPQYEIVTIYTTQGGFTQKPVFRGYRLGAIGAIEISKKDGRVIKDSWIRKQSFDRYYQLNGPLSSVLATEQGIALVFNDQGHLVRYVYKSGIWVESSMGAIVSFLSANSNLNITRDFIPKSIEPSPWYQNQVCIPGEYFQFSQDNKWKSNKNKGLFLLRMPVKLF